MSSEEPTTRLPKGNLELHDESAVTPNLPNADASRDASGGEPWKRAVDQYLRTGSVRLNRYQLRGLLARGGCGVVFEAYDPELDRCVALKLVECSDAGRSRERLLSEARAAGRLSSPHIVTVHDAGACVHSALLTRMAPPERAIRSVFVVMELVDGSDLRRWLNDDRRSWQQVLEIFRQAGEGLAAAHRDGKVHRDFKPGNVLVTADGKAKVADFGLVLDSAEAFDTPADSCSEPGRPTLSGPAGTPRYMSPEQHIADVVDARSDQYSFCLSLYESLYGGLPYVFTNIRELAREKRKGPTLVPTPSSAPRWIRPILLRGLAPHPADRHASMDEVLRSLDFQSRRRLKRWWILGGGSLLLTGMAGFAVVSAENSDACEALLHDVRPLWGMRENSRDIERAFAKLDRSWSSLVSRRTAEGLDAYASRWVRAKHDACWDTRVTKTKSRQVESARGDCLGRAALRFSRLVERLAEGRVELASKAPELVDLLPPPEECMQVDQTMSAEARALAVELERQLVDAELSLAENRFTESAQQAIAIGAQAVGRELVGLRAEAFGVVGRAQMKQGHAHMAVETLIDAAASVRGEDEERAASLELMTVLALTGGARLDEARLLLSLIEARFDQQGVDLEMLIRLYSVKAELEQEVSNYESALQHRAQALQLARQRWPNDARRHAPHLEAMATSYFYLDQAGRARETFLEALEIVEDTYGRTHPRTLGLSYNLAVLDRQDGHLEQARRRFEEILDYHRAVEPWSLDVARTLLALGNVGMDQGEYEAADHSMASAYEIMVSIRGVAHPHTAFFAVAYATAKRLLGELDSAEALASTALEVLERAHGSEHDYSLRALKLLGDIEYDRDNPVGALEHYEECLARRKRRSGPDSPMLTRLLNQIVRLRMRLGQAREARRDAQRVLALARASGSTRQLAAAGFSWAQALLPVDPVAAMAVSEDAVALLRREGADDELIQEIELWNASAGMDSASR